MADKMRYPTVYFGRSRKMGNFVIKNPSRRRFLRTAPGAAAAGLALTDALQFAARAAGQSAAPAGPVTFQLFTAQSIQEDIKALQAKPGNNNLVDAKTMPCTVVLTTEAAKSAKEFEWHEGRDHVLQILEGSTVYEVGGTPKDGRNVKPGEWLAPASEGAATLALKKGDMLVIPRGTPHKRSTAESVTFLLISPMGTAKPQ
jgi:mannose-6-phosphate isomerase-like protein (cupin superfamily)